MGTSRANCIWALVRALCCRALPCLWLVIVSTTLTQCGSDPIVSPAPEDGFRLRKSELEGQFWFLKSLRSVREASNPQANLETGKFLIHDKLIEFRLTENHLQIVSITSTNQQTRPSSEARILASFPIQHLELVDEQQNGNGALRQVAKETTTAWQQRNFIRIRSTEDQNCPFQENTRHSTPGPAIERSDHRDSFSFWVQKQLADHTQLQIQYSFLRKRAANTFQPRTYSDELKRRFGFFDTTVSGTDQYGRPTYPPTHRYLARWNIQSPIRFYYSANFPQHLKDSTQQVFNHWNNAFEQVSGKRPLTLETNSGQHLGDLSYNLIAYEEELSSSKILGYAPGYVNPQSGEILKCDLVFFGRALGRALFRLKKTVGERPAQLDLPLSHPPRFLSGPNPIFPSHPLFRSRSAPPPTFVPKEAFEQFLSHWRSPQSQRSTPLFAHVGALSLMPSLRNKTNQELETLLFTNLIAHELGHCLGLAHNFVASADQSNFPDDVFTTSVMDYPALPFEHVSGPGPYDVAALRVAYGDGQASGNYQYCEHAQAFRPQNPLCLPYDQGTTLEESLEYLSGAYDRSYLWNNERNNRANFAPLDTEYLTTVLTYLVPIRNIFSYANEIVLQSAILVAEPPSSNAHKAAMEKLFSLASQKIEARPTAGGTVHTYRLSDGRNIRIDMHRLVSLRADATFATEDAIELLQDIVEETRRSSVAQYDRDNELIRRGIWPDKLTALWLLLEPFPRAIGRSSASMLQYKPADIFETLRKVLSQTALRDHNTQLRSFYPRLRRYAIEFLRQQANSPTSLSVALDSIRFREFENRADLPRTVRDNLGRLDQWRTRYRDLLNQLSDPTLTDMVRRQTQRNLRQHLRVRNGLNITYLRLNNRNYLSPLTRSIGGQTLESAIGYLFRFQINDAEDHIASLEHILENRRMRLRTEFDASKRQQLQFEIRNTLNSLNEYRGRLQRELQIAQQLIELQE